MITVKKLSSTALKTVTFITQCFLLESSRFTWHCSKSRNWLTIQLTISPDLLVKVQLQPCLVFSTRWRWVISFVPQLF